MNVYNIKRKTEEAYLHVKSRQFRYNKTWILSKAKLDYNKMLSYRRETALQGAL